MRIVTVRLFIFEGNLLLMENILLKSKGGDSSMAFSPLDSFMFSAIPIMVLIGFITVFGFIFFAIASKAKEHFQNNSMEKATMPARIISKRTHVWGGHGDTSASTSYYVTFENEAGDRSEFSVSSSFYGMNVEGDKGMLTHQGTRFLNFERDRF